MSNVEKNWFFDDVDEDDELQIDEYDISSAPNDFNVMTLFNFIQSGSIKIPGFQRNFVWDIKKSSKLIESLILGLPVPQLFIYEQGRNNFLVIDGQQRLMSVYYFIKQRFPKKEKRAELRQIFEANNGIPEDILFNDDYFQRFNLSLPTGLVDRVNPFHGKNYATLADYKTQFDLRPLRIIVIKQNTPEGDDSSMYEIFNRLNSGGANLKPQEIRTSMYHSYFYEVIQDINKLPEWRSILGLPTLDLNMKDNEILLRCIAMLIDFQSYRSSMTKFLNQFSNKMKKADKGNIDFVRETFDSFLEACSELPDKIFYSRGGNRFNIALFESVFRSVCLPYFSKKLLVDYKIDHEKIERLKIDASFVEASSEGTAKKSNLERRFEVADSIFGKQ